MLPDVLAVLNLSLAGASYFRNWLRCAHCGEPLVVANIKFGTTPVGERKVRHVTCRGITYLDH